MVRTLPSNAGVRVQSLIRELRFPCASWPENIIELLAVQHKELTNEDLMELEGQRKDREARGISK